MFFSIGSWPLGEGFHLSSSAEINLSLEVFLTTKEDVGLLLDTFVEGAGQRRKRREKTGVKSGTGTGVRAANKVQGVRGDRELEVTLQVIETGGSLPK